MVSKIKPEARNELHELIQSMKVLKAQYSVELECLKRTYDNLLNVIIKLEKIESGIEIESYINK